MQAVPEGLAKMALKAVVPGPSSCEVCCISEGSFLGQFRVQGSGHTFGCRMV